MTYHTRPLEELDSETTRTRLVELLTANRIPEPEQRYDWLYRSAYARQNIHSEVLLNDDQIIGIASLLKVPRENRNFGCLVNLVVDQNHRTLGPALILEKQLLAHGCERLRPDLLITNPNRKADILPRRLGFHNIGRFTRHSWVANPLGYLNAPSKARGGFGKLSQGLLRSWLAIQAVTHTLREGSTTLPRWQIHRQIAPFAENLPEYERWRHAQPARPSTGIAFIGPPSAKAPFIIFSRNAKGVFNLSDLQNIPAGRMTSHLADFMQQALKEFPVRNFLIAEANSLDLKAALESLGYVPRIDGSELNLYLSACDTKDSGRLQQRLGHIAIHPATIDF